MVHQNEQRPQGSGGDEAKKQPTCTVAHRADDDKASRPPNKPGRPPDDKSVYGPAGGKTPHSEALTAALAYAKLDYRCFPCQADKTPAKRLKWKDRATRDPEELRHLWREYPDEAVGLVVPDGALVLDIDDPDALPAIMGDLTTWPGPVAETPRGGLHLLCKDPRPDGQRGNSTGQLPPGVDVRAGGKGYIVVHGTEGDGRKWLTPLAPPDDLPDYPAQVARMLMPREQRHHQKAIKDRVWQTDRDLAPYCRRAPRTARIR